MVVVGREGIRRRDGVKVGGMEFANIGGGTWVKDEAVDVILENLPVSVRV